MKIDLVGKTAVVVGGSRGIGAGITAALCKAGAVTVFTHTGNPKYKARIEELVADTAKEHCRAEAVVCDARDASETAALIDRIVSQHKRVDILVCNVGQNMAQPAENVTDEGWRDFIDINLTTAFYGVRSVLPHMVREGFGRIILIGSSAAYDGGGGAIDYAAAKAGMDGMVKYLAKNYARKGVLANVVHPCVIDTDLLRERYCDEEKRQKLVAQIPVGRLGKADDIGGLVAYLASGWGDFICGQSFLVDGGRTLFR